MNNERDFKIDPKLSQRYYAGRADHPSNETVKSEEIKKREENKGPVKDYQEEMAINGNIYDCGAHGMTDKLYE